MSRLFLFTGALIGLCALAGPTLAQTPDTLRLPPVQPPAQPPTRPPVEGPRTDTATQSAVDSAAAAAPDSLRVSRSSRWGRQYAVLAWVGGAARVEIVRDDAVRASIPNTGQYRDRVRQEDIGSEASHGITYRVCNAGTPARCSQAVVVQY